MIAKAPLFRDPIHDGPTDPTILWNPLEKRWWIVYTQRRANVEGAGVGWVHGTDLGVASSEDGGHSWLYRGTLNLEAVEPGRNTFWAPDMRREFVELIASGAQADPMVRDSAAFVRLTAA